MLMNNLMSKERNGIYPTCDTHLFSYEKKKKYKRFREIKNLYFVLVTGWQLLSNHLKVLITDKEMFLFTSIKNNDIFLSNISKLCSLTIS